MSRREAKRHYLLTDSTPVTNNDDLDARLGKLLDAKMHGIAFSAYAEGQKPGDELSRDQIERRMAIIAPLVRYVSCQLRELVLLHSKNEIDKSKASESNLANQR